MNWIDPYLFLLTILGIGVLVLSLALLRPPRKLSRTLLACTAGLTGFFILLTVLELVVDQRDLMIVLRNIQQIPLIVTPIMMLGYAKELHQEDTRKTIWLMGVVAIPSIIDLLLLFTDSYHGFMRESITIKSIWNYTEVSVQSTTLNAFLGAYSFVISVVTMFVLIRNMFDVPAHYRKIYWVSALIIALPIVSIITIPLLLPFEIPAVFALSYGSMAMLLILVNKRMDFNAVWPVSRHEILENLSEGIILVDQRGKIIELNQASYQVIKRLFTTNELPSVIYQPVQSVFPNVTPLIDALSMEGDTAFEYEQDGYYFDVQIKILGKKSNRLRLVVWMDVTDKKLTELQLKELAEKDSLTKLATREVFISSYNKLLGTEEGYFLVMDIDHFKLFNDRYGHLVGDKVLKFVARLLEHHFEGSLMTRLGGEEFGVIIQSHIDKTMKAAEEFQAELKNQSRQIDYSIEEEVTVSIGICQLSPNESFERIYQKADQAMYKVKDEGRDSIRVCS
ncbi:diguanylate cyclase [Cytobacillus spongiae]|uniref:histidine kinase N-terminal 7TM domain-containing diguanylate cyclase n=1 Tax=Cytobacillus spongiae TaxID=2901381 RepID=UPI001F3D0A52|nr:GGDEF domain-containing protein [Cytobacillus spongiae]UII55877.1 diguanylate cyclase [Cytobacillus spongiae]